MDTFWAERGRFPADWITHPEADTRATDDLGEAIVMAFRLPFVVDASKTIRIHVSADERYELSLDGNRLGRGPERGDRVNWFLETYDLDLPAGEHLLVARVWWRGRSAPNAQISIRPAFLLCADDPSHRDLLSTGFAKWEVTELPGYTHLPRLMNAFTGDKVRIDGATFAWGWERGAGEGYVKPLNLGAAHNDLQQTDQPRNALILRPATLPPMLEEVTTMGRVRHVEAIDAMPTLPLLVDPGKDLVAEALSWNEMLAGTQSITIPARSVRRVIIDLNDYVCAYPELTLSGQGVARVHWAEALFIPEDAKRVMEMCSHETYMDCPYYEQLMYVGDTRLEVLVTYTWTPDDRLPRKAIDLFGRSRKAPGFTQSRYPCNMAQVIPPFSAWRVAVVHDFAMWRGDLDFVRQNLADVRGVIDAFMNCRNSDGLIEAPLGWNFMDWVPSWKYGIPKDGDAGVSGVINAKVAWVLKQAAALESLCGEPELAALQLRRAGELSSANQSTLLVLPARHDRRRSPAHRLERAHSVHGDPRRSASSRQAFACRFRPPPGSRPRPLHRLFPTLSFRNIRQARSADRAHGPVVRSEGPGIQNGDRSPGAQPLGLPRVGGAPDVPLSGDDLRYSARIAGHGSRRDSAAAWPAHVGARSDAASAWRGSSHRSASGRRSHCGHDRFRAGSDRPAH
jgi:hypothetical protein